jgi:hypothetical protein
MEEGKAIMKIPNVLIVYDTISDPTEEEEAVVVALYPDASKSYPGLFTLTDADVNEVRKAFEPYPRWRVCENGIAIAL